MNELQDVPPHVVSPPAIVQTVFDEEQSIARIKAAVARKDEAKGEYRGAIVDIGRELIAARRAMPGEVKFGNETYSPAFLAYVEKCGLTQKTATSYMSVARNPKRLDEYRNRQSMGARRATLALKIRTALRNGATVEELDRALTEIIGD